MKNITSDISAYFPNLANSRPGSTLSYEKGETVELNDKQIQNQQATAMGAKMNSLGSAADNLLSAATRLGKEVKKETEYWRQILAVKENKWSICRTGARRTLGVQIASAEGKIVT